MTTHTTNTQMHGLGEPLIPIDVGLPYGFTAKKGDKGPLVKLLQQVIASNGYPIAMDGVFGAQTETAIKMMQQKFAQMGAPANLLGPSGVWTQDLTGVYVSQFRKIPGATEEELNELRKSGLVFASRAPKEGPMPESGGGSGGGGGGGGGASIVPAPGAQVVTPSGQIVTPGSGAGTMPGDSMLYSQPDLIKRTAQRLNVPPAVIIIGGGAAALAAVLVGYRLYKGVKSVGPQPQVAFFGLPKKRKSTRNRKKKA